MIKILTDSPNPQVYWRVLKKRLIDEGSNQTVTNCNGLRMVAPDGKMRLTDCFSTKDLLRIIQSIPSPKAEPFKLWLAQVGTVAKKARNEIEKQTGKSIISSENAKILIENRKGLHS